MFGKHINSRVIRLIPRLSCSPCRWFCDAAKAPSTVQYSIVFEVVRGNGYQSDIALDDIKFVNCGDLGKDFESIKYNMQYRWGSVNCSAK